jgi:hypothetical protein
MSEVTPVDATPAKEVPQVNAPSNNKIIVAFPFSAVKISRSDDAVAGLAALVVELAEFVASRPRAPRATLLRNGRVRSLGRSSGIQTASATLPQR